MGSMRLRLMAAFVVAALLPMAAVGLWARSVVVDLAAPRGGLELSVSQLGHGCAPIPE